MRVPPLAPDASFAPLVVDDDGPRARRFRSTSAPPSLVGLETRGLAQLACSGSAQFSAEGWRELRTLLGHVPEEDLYVIDLRQESHGFLNGCAVSWYARWNWGCSGLSSEEALALEALRLQLLERSDTVLVARAEQLKRGEPPAPITWTKQHVASEARQLALPPGRYVRLPVIDHSRPSDAVVDDFIHLVHGLPAGAHLHFHCRGGKGRTSTFLALLDMLRNAAWLSFDSILERQQRLNEYDLRKLPEPQSHKAPYIQERLSFLERFHQYARENPHGKPHTWTDWLATSPR